MEEINESAMLERIEKYRNEFHVTNRRRIRAGIRCLLIVPLIFLILLFMTGSDRIIFLVLWVISMFLIAGYLIYVEYMDFKVDQMVAHVTGRSFDEMHAVTAAAARDSSGKKDKELDRKIKKADGSAEEETGSASEEKAENAEKADDAEADAAEPDPDEGKSAEEDD